ncbi:MAG: type II toxin-antitoxin system PemK/MazF family toxin [Methanoregula sp.]|nr:type II toxin-antitoxin system PemK/MazF family toxin [Methanoregula sp.]
MIREGQIILFNFPQTDQVSGKLRPALVLRSLPDSHDDWLICMITTRLYYETAGIDEVIKMTDPDFSHTGLKLPSLIRVTRVAVVSTSILEGVIGSIPHSRLLRIRARICQWISDGNT